MAFPPLENSDHVVFSVSIDCPINSKQDAPFHCVAYDYSRTDCDGLRDHLRDITWDNIFKLSASAAASDLCEWVQVGIDVYSPRHKYQAQTSLICMAFSSLYRCHSSYKSLFSFVLTE